MTGAGDEAPEGICIVDKPAGWTSHDVVGRARRLLGTRKVGHAGTLDPMATGVLVLGVGRATRLLTFISGVDKSYEATIRLGVETDSLDADGEVVRRHDMAAPTVPALEAAAGQLTGDLEQVPPMVSAVKVDGRRLHQLAREGVEVERAARPVHVARFAVRPGTDPMLVDAEVTCSSGTYVRVLAADLGRLLGGGAHLASLRRTRVGPFDIAEATSIDALEVLPPLEGARHLPQVSVEGDLAASVRHGRVLDAAELGADGPGPWAVVQGERLLAIYAAHREGSVKPSLVLAPPEAG
jgi:tRNA pseudouridine55 synthase